jgi:hypothetical protein
METGKKIPDKIDTSESWFCPHCGKKRNPEKSAVKANLKSQDGLLGEFLSDVSRHYKQAEIFQQHVNERITKEIKDIESGLETGMIESGDLKLNQVRYLTDNFSMKGPEHLIVKSLLLYVSDEEQLYETIVDRHKQLKNANKIDNKDETAIKELGEVINYFNYIRRESNDSSSIKQAIMDEEGSAAYHGDGNIELRGLSKEILEKVDFPEILSPLEREQKGSTVTNQKFKVFLVHEMTHAWLDYSVENWSTNGIYNDIDEIFAYFIGWRYGMKIPSDIPNHIYHNTDFIEWGSRVLKEKAQEIKESRRGVNWTDWARWTQKRIYERTDESEEYKREFVFLRLCISHKDHEKLDELEELDKRFELDVRKVQRIIWKFASESDFSEEEKEEIRFIANSLNFQEGEIGSSKDTLNSTVKEALSEEGYPDLDWVSNLISEKILKRSDEAERDVKDLNKFLEDFSGKLERNEVKSIRDLNSELENIAEELRKIANR